MEGFLRFNTQTKIMVGPFVDETDGYTGETGLTLSQADIRVSKNGDTFTQAGDSGGATHNEFGYYSTILLPSDLDKMGTLTLAVNESGARPVKQTYTVLDTNVFDSLVGDSDVLNDFLQVDHVETLGSTPSTLSDIADSIHDEIIEGDLTSRQIQKIILSAVAGITQSNGTAFRNLGDSITRISSTLDGNGNRTSVVLDGN